jgi:hypothetical protein
MKSCRRLKLPVRDYMAAILPGLPISRSSASQTFPPRGSPSIDCRRRGVSVKAILRQQPHSLLFTDHAPFDARD